MIFIKRVMWISYVDYMKNYKTYRTNFHVGYMHSHTYEYLLKGLDQDWNSYFGLVKSYKKDSSKFKSEPHRPRYKKGNKKNLVIFSNYAIRIKENILMLSLSKKMQEKYRVKSLNFLISDKLKSLIKIGKLKQIKIKYNSNTKSYEFIAVREIKESVLDSSYNNVAAIDVGLNNLVACTNEKNSDALLVNGKPLKCKNRYLNNRINNLKSLNMKKQNKEKQNKEEQKDKNYKIIKSSKRINKLREYRKNYINTYMNKTAKKVVEYAINNKCCKVIIGDISNIKQSMKYNKSFKEVPVQKLVYKIENKLKQNGVKVIKIKEAYTSGCSSLDLEEISRKTYNKSRRIKRGLFKTNSGIIINSDINGSLNILRKYLKDNSIPNLVKEAMDKGYTRHPIKSLIS